MGKLVAEMMVRLTGLLLPAMATADSHATVRGRALPPHYLYEAAALPDSDAGVRQTAGSPL